MFVNGINRVVLNSQIPAIRPNNDSTFNLYMKPQPPVDKRLGLTQRAIKVVGFALRKTVQLVVLATAALFYAVSLGRIDFRGFDPFKSRVKKGEPITEVTPTSKLYLLGLNALNKFRANRQHIVNSLEVNVLGVARNTTTYAQLAITNLVRGNFRIASLFAASIFVDNHKALLKMTVGKELGSGYSEASKNEKYGSLLVVTE